MYPLTSCSSLEIVCSVVLSSLADDDVDVVGGVLVVVEQLRGRQFIYLHTKYLSLSLGT